MHLSTCGRRKSFQEEGAAGTKAARGLKKLQSNQWDGALGLMARQIGMRLEKKSQGKS